MSTDPVTDPTVGPTTGADEPAHPHGPVHVDPVLDEVEEHVDPAVAEAVHSVRDRFGAAGLRDLITLAGYELEVAEQAMTQLREEVVDVDKPYDQLADEATAAPPAGRTGATGTGDAGTG